MSDASIDKRAVRRSFERAAAGYADAAALQQALAGRLLARARRLHDQPARILDAGGGGARLAAAYPRADIVACDLSQRMLRAARADRDHARDGGSVCADLEKLPFATAVFDLAHSNAALHWCPRPQAALHEWRRVLREEGLLLASCFCAGTLAELRDSWTGVDRFSHALRFPDAGALPGMLAAAGLVPIFTWTEREVVLYDDVRALLQSLRATGARNPRRDRPPGLTTPGQMRRMTERYRRRHAARGRIAATYEIAIFAARALP